MASIMAKPVCILSAPPSTTIVKRPFSAAKIAALILFVLAVIGFLVYLGKR